MVEYRCGCRAAGDNVSTFCPMHGMRNLTPEEIAIVHKVWEGKMGKKKKPVKKTKVAAKKGGK